MITIGILPETARRMRRALGYASKAAFLLGLLPAFFLFSPPFERGRTSSQLSRSHARRSPLLSASSLRSQDPTGRNVRLDVAVLDKNHRPVTGLTQNDLEVWEDGKVQTISSFSGQATPISYVLLIDASGSMKNQLNNVISLARAIVGSTDEKDQGLIVGFKAQAEAFTSEFTADKTDLLARINLIKKAGGASALLDAVHLSVEAQGKNMQQRSGERRRRAVILITDGDDNNSYYKPDEVFDYLKKNYVEVIAVGFRKDLQYSGDNYSWTRYARATTLLKQFAQATGGYTLVADGKKPDAVAAEVISYLHGQYSVGYLSNSPPSAGKYHKVSVKLRSSDAHKGLSVLTRPEYAEP
jgi:Ca-activated chloride channel family protein